MESRAATLTPELPEQSPETFDPQNLPLEERLAMLSLSLATIAYLRARDRVIPLTENELQNPKKLEQDFEDKEVADHEIGHRLAALALGWELIMTTVVPGDGYRGLNVASPNTSRSHTQLMHDAVCIAVAGYTAMEMMNNSDPHHGAGSDKGKAKSLARQLAIYEYQDPGHEDQIISSEESRARGLISSEGNADFESHILAIKKTI